MRKLYLINILFLGWAGGISAQDYKEALFIGNSYTYVNDLPGMIAAIASSKGDSLWWDSNTPGGYTFELHSQDPVTKAKIFSRPWDYVILQEQSQRPALDPDTVQLYVYPYADSLNRFIKTNDSCTRTLFYMTWGRKYGDLENCPVYPPICTFEGMQQRLKESYLEMGQMFDAEVSPVGMSWKRTRNDHPGIELYQGDNSHPSVEGSYLAACTFYAAIFHKSPVGAIAPPALADSTVQILQSIASAMVFDSLALWRIDTADTRAGFAWSYPGDGSVAFSNQSVNAISYLWDFGDGQISAEENPVHLYQDPGVVYSVTLTAQDTCKKDISVKEVYCPPVGIPGVPDHYSMHIFPNPARDIVHIRIRPSENDADVPMSLSDIFGRVILSAKLKHGSGDISVSGLDPGIYFLSAEIQDQTIIKRIAVI